MPVAQRLAWGSHAVRPPPFGRGPPKKYIRWAFPSPPAKIHTAVHPPFPIPQPHPPSGAQNQTMGNWPLRGTVLGGVLFAPPVLGPWAIDHKSKEMGVEVQLWEPHFLGPSGSLALFCSFGLLNISGPPGPPSHLPIPNLSPTNPPILGQT